MYQESAERVGENGKGEGDASEYHTELAGGSRQDDGGNLLQRTMAISTALTCACRLACLRRRGPEREGGAGVSLAVPLLWEGRSIAGEKHKSRFDFRPAFAIMSGSPPSHVEPQLHQKRGHTDGRCGAPASAPSTGIFSAVYQRAIQGSQEPISRGARCGPGLHLGAFAPAEEYCFGQGYSGPRCLANCMVDMLAGYSANIYNEIRLTSCMLMPIFSTNGPSHPLPATSSPVSSRGPEKQSILQPLGRGSVRETLPDASRGWWTICGADDSCPPPITPQCFTSPLRGLHFLQYWGNVCLSSIAEANSMDSALAASAKMPGCMDCDRSNP